MILAAASEYIPSPLLHCQCSWSTRMLRVVTRSSMLPLSESDPELEEEPHAACERTGMILAAESIPSPLQLMLVTPELGIGKSDSPVHPVFFLEKTGDFKFPIPDSRFPIPDSAGNRDREIPRFPPIRPGTGNRGPGAAGRGFPGLLFWKAYLSIKQPLTAHGPIHLKVSSRHDP